MSQVKDEVFKSLMKLLDKAIETDNSKLIDHVTSKLDSLESTTLAEEHNKEIVELDKPKREIIKPPANKNSRILDIGQFKMKKGEKSGSLGKVPVNKIKRENSWEDDGSLDRPEDNPELVTPKAPKAPRERAPSRDVKITCSRCNQLVKVPKKLIRENYVCDNCISGLRKRGGGDE